MFMLQVFTSLPLPFYLLLRLPFHLPRTDPTAAGDTRQTHSFAHPCPLRLSPANETAFSGKHCARDSERWCVECCFDRNSSATAV